MKTQSTDTVRERPMLFSCEMVQAILDGRKSQTRRIVTNDLGVCEACWHESCPHNPSGEETGVFAPYLRVGYCDHNEKCGQRIAPRWSPGDRIWVREAFYQCGHWEAMPGVKTKTGRQKWKFVPDSSEIRFAAPPEFRKGRHCKDPQTVAWHKRLARFMPRAASRITLEILSVRVERLQEISEEDAWAEGVTLYGTTRWETESRQAYKLLWESINGAGSWEKNPWVWILEFRRVGLTAKDAKV